MSYDPGKCLKKSISRFIYFLNKKKWKNSREEGLDVVPYIRYDVKMGEIKTNPSSGLKMFLAILFFFIITLQSLHIVFYVSKKQKL